MVFEHPSQPAAPQRGRLPDPQSSPRDATQSTHGLRLLRLARWLFGLVFALNLGLQWQPAAVGAIERGVHAAMVSAAWGWQRDWAAVAAGALHSVGATAVAAAWFGLQTLLALSLLTSWGLPLLALVGLAAELLVWSAVGGFALTGVGATGLVYALGFALLLLLRAWQGAAWARTALAAAPSLWRLSLAFWLVGSMWLLQMWHAAAGGLIAPAQAGVTLAAPAQAPGWPVVEAVHAEVQSMLHGLVLALGRPAFAVIGGELLRLVILLIGLGVLVAPLLPRAVRRMALWLALVFSLVAWVATQVLGGMFAQGLDVGGALPLALAFVFLLGAPFGRDSGSEPIAGESAEAPLWLDTRPH